MTRKKLVNLKESNKHIRSITGLTCYICKLYVQGKENIEMHFINSHNQNWLTCPHCDLSFTRYDTKTRHIKKHCKKYVGKIQQLEKANNRVEIVNPKEIIPEHTEKMHDKSSKEETTMETCEETTYPYIEGN